MSYAHVVGQIIFYRVRQRFIGRAVSGFQRVDRRAERHERGFIVFITPESAKPVLSALSALLYLAPAAAEKLDSSKSLIRSLSLTPKSALIKNATVPVSSAPLSQ